jgi:hypothetical protein
MVNLILDSGGTLPVPVTPDLHYRSVDLLCSLWIAVLMIEISQELQFMRASVKRSFYRFTILWLPVFSE